MVCLYGLGQLSPQKLTYEVELRPRIICSHQSFWIAFCYFNELTSSIVLLHVTLKFRMRDFVSHGKRCIGDMSKSANCSSESVLIIGLIPLLAK